MSLHFHSARLKSAAAHLLTHFVQRGGGEEEEEEEEEAVVARGCGNSGDPVGKLPVKRRRVNEEG